MNGSATGARAPALRWRRTLGATALLTSAAAAVGSVQLMAGVFTPPVSDLSSLGLQSWVLPGLWLAASVALPCAATAFLARKCSPWLGAAAVGSGALLLVELAVQIPFIGLDPLQAVMAAVAVFMASLGFVSHRTRSSTA